MKPIPPPAPRCLTCGRRGCVTDDEWHRAYAAVLVARNALAALLGTSIRCTGHIADKFTLYCGYIAEAEDSALRAAVDRGDIIVR